MEESPCAARSRPSRGVAGAGHGKASAVPGRKKIGKGTTPVRGKVPTRSAECDQLPYRVVRRIGPAVEHDRVGSRGTAFADDPLTIGRALLLPPIPSLDPCLAKLKNYVGERRPLPLTCSCRRLSSAHDRASRSAWLYGWLYSHLLIRSLAGLPGSARRSLQLLVAALYSSAAASVCPAPLLSSVVVTTGRVPPSRQF